MVEVMNYGVMSTPAIVIDGEVKTRGKILREQEVIDLLKEPPILTINAISER